MHEVERRVLDSVGIGVAATKDVAGRSSSAAVVFPSGHARNPMTDREIVEKLRSNGAERWDDARASRIEDAAWRLHETGGIDRLLEGLRG